MTDSNDKRLFWGCFIALIATAFGFVIRSALLDTWTEEFNFSKTQSGVILGAGLWPFAVSIILFSLIIDKIGYKTAMVFAFVCHIGSALLTIFGPKYGDPYTMLYLGSFVCALGNGTVEAVVNPVVATMFSKQKTKWLNILHAGWPGGLVLAGLILVGMSASEAEWAKAWQVKVGLIFIPTVLYGLIMLTCRFPINERVEAGVPYKDMLKELGMGGAFIASFLMVSAIVAFFSDISPMVASNSEYIRWGAIAALTLGFGAVVNFAIGRPLVLFMLLIMIPLATTELGTDSWITPLMDSTMKQAGFNALWVLIYTSLIMMILRFFAGSIVHTISPLGLLAASALVAAAGLTFLSMAEGLVMIFVAATVYGFGKTFFWPTMLGVVSEQSPKGGALTLNVTGGVGMLGVGVLGTVLMGYIQDQGIAKHLNADNPALAKQILVTKDTSLGKREVVNADAVKALPEAEKVELKKVEQVVTKEALAKQAILPCIMFVCYLVLIAYFKSRGGYQAQVLTGHGAEDAKFTGGVAGPVE